MGRVVRRESTINKDPPHNTEEKPTKTPASQAKSSEDRAAEGSLAPLVRFDVAPTRADWAV